MNLRTLVHILFQIVTTHSCEKLTTHACQMVTVGMSHKVITIIGHIDGWLIDEFNVGIELRSLLPPTA